MEKAYGKNFRIPVVGEEGRHVGHSVRAIQISDKEFIKGLYCNKCKIFIASLYATNKWELEKAFEHARKNESKFVLFDEKHVDQEIEFFKLCGYENNGDPTMMTPQSPSFDLKSEIADVTTGLDKMTVAEKRFVEQHRATSVKESDFQKDTLQEVEIETGIRAVIGKRNGEDFLSVHAYLFDSKKLTPEAVAEWMKFRKIQMDSLVVAEKGGAGSGNFGHAGREGMRGGSAPSENMVHEMNPSYVNVPRDEQGRTPYMQMKETHKQMVNNGFVKKGTFTHDGEGGGKQRTTIANKHPINDKHMKKLSSKTTSDGGKSLMEPYPETVEALEAYPDHLKERMLSAKGIGAIAQESSFVSFTTDDGGSFSEQRGRGGEINISAGMKEEYGPAMFKSIMVHEMAHALDASYKKDPNFKVRASESKELRDAVKAGGKAVSEYATKNEYEYFAEHVTAYVYSPKTVEKLNPAMYKFVDSLFKGTAQTLNKYIAEGTEEGEELKIVDDFKDSVVHYFGGEQIDKGGAGSGNFGHEGREGERGGSAPSGGSSVSERESLERGDVEKNIERYNEKYGNRWTIQPNAKGMNEAWIFPSGEALLVSDTASHDTVLMRLAGLDKPDMGQGKSDELMMRAFKEGWVRKAGEKSYQLDFNDDKAIGNVEADIKLNGADKPFIRSGNYYFESPSTKMGSGKINRTVDSDDLNDKRFDLTMALRNPADMDWMRYKVRKDKGGKGSGNFGHEGIHGHRGGSMTQGGIRMPKIDVGQRKMNLKFADEKKAKELYAKLRSEAKAKNMSSKEIAALAFRKAYGETKITESESLRVVGEHWGGIDGVFDDSPNDEVTAARGFNLGELYKQETEGGTAEPQAIGGTRDLKPEEDVPEGTVVGDSSIFSNKPQALRNLTIVTEVGGHLQASRKNVAQVRFTVDDKEGRVLMWEENDGTHARMEGAGDKTERVFQGSSVSLILDQMVPDGAVKLSVDLGNQKMFEKGGAGSGNWGHAGVEGQRGGSAPRGANQPLPRMSERSLKPEERKEWEMLTPSGKEDYLIHRGAGTTHVVSFALAEPMRRSDANANQSAIRIVMAQRYNVQTLKELKNANFGYVVVTQVDSLIIAKEKLLAGGIDAESDENHIFKSKGQPVAIWIEADKMLMLLSKACATANGGSKKPRKDKTMNKNTSAEFSDEVMEIIKRDDEKRLVYGVFLYPERADHDGDVISADDIEKVAHGFLTEYRTIDEMHKAIIEAEIVESAIAWDDNLVYHGKSLNKGTWFGAIRVNDDKVWDKVKNGTYKGFSVRISGQREAIEEKFVEKGGQGSGNFGHEGIEGHRGGSAPSGSSSESNADKFGTPEKPYVPSKYSTAYAQDMTEAYMKSMGGTRVKLTGSGMGAGTSAMEVHKMIDAKDLPEEHQRIESYLTGSGLNKEAGIGNAEFDTPSTVPMWFQVEKFARLGISVDFWDEKSMVNPTDAKIEKGKALIRTVISGRPRSKGKSLSETELTDEMVQEASSEIEKGGAGSGNFGHAGIEGHRGGSLAGTGGGGPDTESNSGRTPNGQKKVDALEANLAGMTDRTGKPVKLVVSYVGRMMKDGSLMVGWDNQSSKATNKDFERQLKDKLKDNGWEIIGSTHVEESGGTVIADHPDVPSNRNSPKKEE